MNRLQRLFSRDLRLVGLTATVVLLLASSGGCAAIIGLGDGELAERDASVTPGRDGGHSGDSGDDDDDDDAADATANREASAGDAAVDSGPFVPRAGWQVDETFGSGGWATFPGAVGADPPVISAEDGGLLDLAASAAGDGTGLLVGLRLDPGAAPSDLITTALAGAPTDLVVAGGNAYLLTSQVTSMFGVTVSETVAARLDDGGASPVTSTYRVTPDGTCTGRKIVAADGDAVTALTNCSINAASSFPEEGTMSFTLGSGATPTFSGQQDLLGGPPQVVADAVPVAGGTWVVGCNSCDGTPSASYGLYTLVESDGSIPSRGQFGLDDQVAASVSAVLPQDDGTAWLFGVSTGSFFTAQVPGVADGTATPGAATPPFFARVVVGEPTTVLQQASTSRTRMVLDSVGTRLLVGAAQDAAQIAVAVVAPGDGGFGFADDFSGRAHLVAAPANVTAVALGGVALIPAPGGDDYAYVATTLTSSTGQQLALLRLLRHSPRDD